MAPKERPADRIHGILVTYHRPDQLRGTLVALARQSRPVEDLLVVDNGADDRIEAIVAEAGPMARYLAAPENLGPAGGIALGMRTILDEQAPDADWILVLDDDDPPKSDDLFATLVDFADQVRQQHPDVGAVGMVGARFDWRRGRIVPVPDDELTGMVAVDYIGGGRFPFYPVGAVRSVGVPDERLFFGLDDLEYGLRMRRAGRPLFVHGDRWLAQRRSSGRIGRSFAPSSRLGEPNWRRYYSLRNQILILRGQHAELAALRVTATMMLKPLANLPRAPRPAMAHLALSARAGRDGWLGRSGRTVEPTSAASRPRRTARVGQEEES